MATLTLPRLKKKLQILVNAYVRKRDEGKPCISCGRHEPLEAGHYYPVKGYDGLRFDLDNIHGECARCNRFDDAHLIGYTKNIEQRIGEDARFALGCKAHDYKLSGYKWSRPELIEMIEDFKNK